MRRALAPGAALAVCRLGLEDAPAESQEASFADLNETVRHLAQRVEAMERERNVQEECEDATSSV